MYHRSLYDIVMETGRSIGVLTQEMQGEDELFASTLTLRAVEAQLLIMAHTLGNVTPALHQRLIQVDWIGWAALHDKLRNGVQPRREGDLVCRQRPGAADDDLAGRTAAPTAGVVRGRLLTGS